MSLWTSEKQSGEGAGTEITSVPYAELVLFGAMFGVPLVLLLSAPLALGPPKIAAVVIYGLIGTGFGLFLVAKASVIRRGQLVSFGSADMSTPMRWCYRGGYVLGGLGTALALGVLKWWAAA